MAGEPPIRTHGTLVRQGPGHTFVAALPNGKEVVAYPAHHLRNAPGLVPGARVALELTPYDFSKARIAAPDPEPGGPRPRPLS